MISINTVNIFPNSQSLSTVPEFVVQKKGLTIYPQFTTPMSSMEININLFDPFQAAQSYCLCDISRNLYNKNSSFSMSYDNAYNRNSFMQSGPSQSTFQVSQNDSIKTRNPENEEDKASGLAENFSRNFENANEFKAPKQK